MVRFKNRYILVEIETSNEESINDISSYDLLNVKRKVPLVPNLTSGY